MIIKKLNDVPFEDMGDHESMTKQIVIGSKDGSKEMVLRFFSLGPGARSPYHTHPFPHIVHVVQGTGMVTDRNGNKHSLSSGDFIYVDDNEQHCFENTGKDKFDFYCTVPARGEVLK